MKGVFISGAAAAPLMLAGCDAGPSAKAPPATAVTGQTVTTASAGAAGGTDPRDLPVPMVNGKPMWAANKKHTAQENADYQFGKNGRDFGAVTEADYVAKAHAFVDAPPAGVQKLARSNGDALLYDVRTNTFAVVTKTGAPRTMFKPRDGEDYWKQQQQRDAASKAKADDNSQG